MVRRIDDADMGPWPTSQRLTERDRKLARADVVNLREFIAGQWTCREHWHLVRAGVARSLGRPPLAEIRAGTKVKRLGKVLR